MLRNVLQLIIKTYARLQKNEKNYRNISADYMITDYYTNFCMITVVHINFCMIIGNYTNFCVITGDCDNYEDSAPWIKDKDYQPFTAEEYW